MKELVRVPPGLRSRIQRLVEYYAKQLGTTEEDARRTVEVAILTRGVAALEEDRREAVAG